MRRFFDILAGWLLCNKFDRIIEARGRQWVDA